MKSIAGHHLSLGALFVLLLLLLANATISLAQDQGSEAMDGDTPRESRLVHFQSEYNDALNLYWIGDKLDAAHEKLTPVLIVEIPPRGEAAVNSFDFHMFYASRVVDEVRAIPRKVTISPNIDLYTFRPDGVRPTSDKSEATGTARKSTDTIETAISRESVSIKRTFAKVPIAGRVYENRNRDPVVNSGLHPAVTLLRSSTQVRAHALFLGVNLCAFVCYG